MRRSVGANRLLCGALLVLAAALPNARAQDSYPNRPIRIVVPTAPGGPSDVSARTIAQELTKRWGRQVVVDIRPGAGTIIGSEIVARAPPDGYTLLVSPSTLAINPVSYKKMPYDALRDFAPITHTLVVPNLVVMHPSLPAKSVKEWSGLLAPAGTPREIIVMLHREAVSILRAPEARERLANDGAEVVGSSPAEFSAFLRAETVKWAKVAKLAGIQPE